MELLLGLLIGTVTWLLPLVVCIAKGKYWVALACAAGVFVMVSALVLIPLVVPIGCAIRLAKPSSFWAKRFYRGREACPRA